MADRYWVPIAGVSTGNWSGSGGNHWATASNGTPGASVPTAADNVIFDGSSGTDNYTVTIDASAACLNFTANKPTGVGKKVTFAGSAALVIAGNLNLAGGSAEIASTYTGAITFTATSGTKTIFTNGVPQLGSYIFDGVGGTFQLSSDLTINNGNRGITLTNGIFDPNGKTVALGSSGATYTITGNITFYNLTITPFAGKTDTLLLSGSITITHTATITGNSAINRLLVQAAIIGVPATLTITGTTGNSFSNVDFRDINLVNIVTGSQVDLDLHTDVLCPGGSGNCGGNTGITFTPAANQYWFKTSGAASWSTVGNWYLGTGGSGGAGRVPLPQDIAIFDNLSFGATGMTITQDMPRIPTTTFRGVDDSHLVTNTPTFTTSSSASIFGSLTLTPGMVLTASSQTYTFEGRSNSTLTSAGQTWAKNIVLQKPGATLTLEDDFTDGATLSLTCNNGTFDANGHTVTIGNVVCTVAAGMSVGATIGNGTFIVGKSSGQVWGVNVNAFVLSNTNVKIVDSGNSAVTFDGGGKTYHDVWFARGASTGDITITGANTFTDLKDDGSEAHTIIFPNATSNFTTFHISGSAGKLITLARTGASGQFTLAAASSAKIDCNYLSISNSVVTPANTWYANLTSTDGGNNSGWVFKFYAAALSALTASLSLLAVTALYAAIKLATIEPANLVVSNPGVTSVYAEIDHASVLPASINATLRPVNGRYVFVKTAAVDPADITISTPNVHATYIYRQTAEINPVTIDLLVEDSTATYKEKDAANFTPPALHAALEPITASYKAIIRANSVPIGVRLSLPNLHATYVRIFRAEPTTTSAHFSLPNVRATYPAADVDNIIISLRDVTLISINV